MNGEAIVMAIGCLHRTYPDERTDLWCGYTPEGKESYTARVGDGGSSTLVFGHGPTPEQAVEECVQRAGDRSPATLRELEIANLKERLAELEAVEVL